MRTWVLAIVLAWAGLIFATSCTVVTTDGLFSIVGAIVGQERLHDFEVFWGVAWFAIVKGWHAIEFAVLTALLVVCLNAWRPRRKTQNLLVAGAVALAFAASDEYHQTFVPDRFGTVSDVLIDSLGIASVLTLGWMRLPRA